MDNKSSGRALVYRWCLGIYVSGRCIGGDIEYLGFLGGVCSTCGRVSCGGVSFVWVYVVCMLCEFVPGECRD